MTDSYNPPKTFFLPAEEIKLKDRIRKSFDEKRAKELERSISEKGQIHPAVLDESGYLISGERRTRACAALNIPVLCIRRSDLDATAAYELELEENLTREDLTPQEIVRARANLFRLKGGGRPRTGGQPVPSLEEIASQMGITKGQLSQDLKIAPWLDLIPELATASTKAEMLAKVKHLEAQAQWYEDTAKIRKETGLAVPNPEPVTSQAPYIDPLSDVNPSDQESIPNPLAFMELRPGTDEWKNHWRKFPSYQSFMLEFSRAWESGEAWTPPDECLTMAQSVRSLGATPAPIKIQTDLASIQRSVLQSRFAKADARLLTGDALTILSEPLKFGAPTIIFFDPPWGVDHDSKLSGTGSGYQTYEDSPEHAASIFPRLAQLLFDQAAPNSHLYCFFSIANLESTYSTLESCGWTVNRRPIIWAKPGIRSTRAPETWPGASYEAIAFARKGNKPLVQKKGDYIEGIKQTLPSQKGHPAAKPPELYLDLLARSGHVGDLIFDPCFGSGPAFRACELAHQLQLEWCGIEKEEVWKNLALVKLTELWSGKKEGEFTDKLSLFND